MSRNVVSCAVYVGSINILELDMLRIIGFVVVTAVVMKGSILCDITLYSPLKVNRRF
jgi:hypothetical protein